MAALLHTHAKSVWRRDPTRTSGLRRQFLADLNRRFENIRRLVRQRVLEQGIPDPDRFVSWLRNLQNGQILAARATVQAEPFWQPYIRTAYRQGLIQAGNNLRSKGLEVSDRWLDASFMDSPHVAKVRPYFARTRYSLESALTSMNSAMIVRLTDGKPIRANVDFKEVAARGIADRLSPRELAKKLSEEIEISRMRALRIARTEIIAAYAEASLNAYTEAGVSGVELQAEFLTAEDDQVCARCDELSKTNGGIYTIEEAQGLIPVHPNCRCAWAPVVEDLDELRGLL